MAHRSTSQKFVTLAAIGLMAVGTYKLGNVLFGETIDAQRLANQVWIEKLPTDDRDMIRHLVLVDDSGERFGAFGKSSTWRHFVEIFRWQQDGNRLNLVLPQDRKRVSLSVKVWNCEGEAPAPFQLCLELSNNRNSALYYSRREWTIDANHNIAELAAEHPTVAAALERFSPPPVVDATDFDAADDLFE